MFDGFRAGCVPIYLGPPNSADFLPANSVLDYSKFKGVQELMQEVVRCACTAQAVELPDAPPALCRAPGRCNQLFAGSAYP